MKKVAVFLIFTLLTLQLHSQIDVHKSNNIMVILGRKFYIHVVKKGETLYSISKSYNISQNEILEINKLTPEEIKVGEAIKIPMIVGINSNDNDQEENQKFVYHKVEKKQSLYSISKQYNITESQLIRFNPDLNDGIKSGMILKIPLFAEENVVETNNIYTDHKVEGGETMFSIAQQYGVSIEQIKKCNPSAEHGIRTGQILHIPKKELNDNEQNIVKNDSFVVPDFKFYDPLYFTDPSCEPCSKFQYTTDKKFKVALMLPLFLENNIDLSYDLATDPNKSLYKNSERFIEFYEGALQAINDLREKNLSVDLYVYDTENSNEKVSVILTNPELKEMDLIIGPVYYENFKIAAQFAYDNRINIVSPFSQKNDITQTNPFVFQVNPSFNNIIESTSNFILNKYDSSIVIVHNGNAEELETVELYKEKLIKQFNSNQNIREIPLKIVNYKEKGMAGVVASLSVGLKNIVIIPSSNEVFVTDVVGKLSGLVNDHRYDVTLLGQQNWENFRNIDIDHLQKLKLHFPTYTFADYSQWRVKSFVYKYRELYKTEPTPFSFQGYDIMFYYLSALKKYGKYFQFCINPQDVEPNRYGLFLEFNYQRVNKTGGFENNGVFLLNYDSELNLKKIEIDPLN